MHDVNRDAVTKLVFQKLADPGFRARLSAKAPDGSCPIVVAIRDDSLRSLVDQLAAAGGAANVAVPALNGVVVFAMHAERASRERSGVAAPPRLAADCTVALFVERFRLDSAADVQPVYRFVVDGPDRRREQARAELVAVAG